MNHDHDYCTCESCVRAKLQCTCQNFGECNCKEPCPACPPKKTCSCGPNEGCTSCAKPEAPVNDGKFVTAAAVRQQIYQAMMKILQVDSKAECTTTAITLVQLSEAIKNLRIEGAVPYNE